MARYIGPVCKLCRREGMKLYLKGERCFTEKCAVTRRPYPPGQHGQGRIKLSEYGLRLREKQKMRRIYGVLERSSAATTCEATRLQGPHRRRDARPHRAPPRQRRAPHGLRVSRAQGAPARAPQPRARQRQARRTSRATASSRATRSRFARRAARSSSSPPRSPQPRAARSSSWLEVDKDELRRHVQGRCRFATSSTSRRFASSTSSSTTRADQRRDCELRAAYAGRPRVATGERVPRRDRDGRANPADEEKETTAWSRNMMTPQLARSDPPARHPASSRSRAPSSTASSPASRSSAASASRSATRSVACSSRRSRARPSRPSASTARCTSSRPSPTSSRT